MGILATHGTQKLQVDDALVGTTGICRIAGIFRGSKLWRIAENLIFVIKTFMDCGNRQWHAHWQWCRRTQWNFLWLKLLWIALKPWNSRKFSPAKDSRYTVNDVTIPDRYLVPHIQHFSTNLTEAQVFSKIDQVKGYHQILVAPKDIPKTAIITPFSLYEFLRMLFGL